MRRRILSAILITTALALALFGVPLGIATGRTRMDAATLRLEREATLAVGTVSNNALTSNDPVELPRVGGISLALYSRSGTRIAGIGPKRSDRFVRQAAKNHIASGEDGETLVAAVPVSSDERVVGVLRASQSLTTIDNEIVRARIKLVAFGLGVLVLAAAVGAILARRIARRVETVREAAVQLGEGRFALRAALTGIRELDDVGRALHSTSDRLREAMKRERSFSANASHQLRTPLTGLRLILENELADALPSGAIGGSPPSAALQASLYQVDRLESTIDELLLLARTPPASQRPLDVDQLISTVVARWAPDFARVGRALQKGAPVGGTGRGSDARPEAILQAIEVLLDNALRHGGGVVSVASAPVSGGIAITVTDAGDGVTDPGQLFRTTTETTASPHGIGLTLARTLVEGEGGRLLLERAVDPTRFTIVLPVRP